MDVSCSIGILSVYTLPLLALYNLLFLSWTNIITAILFGVK